MVADIQKAILLVNKIIQDSYPVSSNQELGHKNRSDISGGAGDQYFIIFYLI